MMMSPAKEQELHNRYANLFEVPRGYRDKIKDEHIRCGDGWFDLVDETLAKLEKLKGVKVYSIKEHFGYLQFNISAAKLAAYITVDAAELSSGDICEACGRPSQQPGVARARTRCPACLEKE